MNITGKFKGVFNHLNSPCITIFISQEKKTIDTELKGFLHELPKLKEDVDRYRSLEDLNRIEPHTVIEKLIVADDLFSKINKTVKKIGHEH